LRFGAVIWTRLAPDPLADDGHGGMPARPVDVDWEVAIDDAFTRASSTAARQRRCADC
jgi:alkaline phosphatase D